MNVTQSAINEGMKAGRKALQDYSMFASMEVSDDALRTFVTDVLIAGFGTVPKNTIMGPGAHPHPLVNPSLEPAPSVNQADVNQHQAAEHVADEDENLDDEDDTDDQDDDGEHEEEEHDERKSS